MSLTLKDEDGAVYGEIFWRQHTTSQPENELSIVRSGSRPFHFDADEFLDILADVPLDGRTTRVLTHYLEAEEAKRFGRATTQVDAFQWDPNREAVLSIGAVSVRKSELAPLIYWLLSQVLWIQDSSRPLRRFNEATREKLEALRRWAKGNDG